MIKCTGFRGMCNGEAVAKVTCEPYVDDTCHAVLDGEADTCPGHYNCKNCVKLVEKYNKLSEFAISKIVMFQ